VNYNPPAPRADAKTRIVGIAADDEVRVLRPQAWKEKRGMNYFAVLDESVKNTSVCILDEMGKVVREVKVASEPEALVVVLKNFAYQFKRIGLEAGPLSPWVFSALAEAGLPVICVDAVSRCSAQTARRKTMDDKKTKSGPTEVHNEPRDEASNEQVNFDKAQGSSRTEERTCET
jgi:hypothetical protein